MGGSPGDVSEEPVTQEKRKKSWRMSYVVGKATEGLGIELDVGEVKERLENELLILQPFLQFTYVKLILQHCRCFT